MKTKLLKILSENSKELCLITNTDHLRNLVDISNHSDRYRKRLYSIINTIEKNNNRITPKQFTTLQKSVLTSITMRPCKDIRK